jgi:glycosyltransferase involved in cell wall biosynthesis
MLGGRDLTIVPSVWWDNAPQTVFESMACGVPVLGANIGGIPDFVKDGVNGLLFMANSRRSLADTITKAVEDPHMVWGLRANVKPPKSIENHALEMVQVYSGVDPDRVAIGEAVQVRGLGVPVTI